MKIGATTVFTTGNIGVGSNANRLKWRLSWDIYIQSTTAQDNSAQFILSNNGTAAMLVAFQYMVGYAAATEDFASAKNIVLSGQMTTANANADMIMEGYYMEKLAG